MDLANPVLRVGDADQQRRVDEDLLACIEVLRATAAGGSPTAGMKTYTHKHAHKHAHKHSPLHADRQRRVDEDLLACIEVLRATPQPV